MEQNEELQGFTWEDTGEATFVEEGFLKETKIEDNKTEETVIKKEDLESRKEEVKDDLFDWDSEDKEEHTSVPNNSKQEEIKPVNKTKVRTFKDFKERGFLRNLELDENEEIDEERFTELQEEDYQAAVNERLKDFATEGLDEDARAFLKFKKEGGNTMDFLNLYSKNSNIPSGDIDDEDFQDEVIRYQLTLEEWDEEEIEERLESLTASGKKQNVAERYNNKLLQQKKKEEDKLVQQVQQQKEQAKAQEEGFRISIKEELDKTEEIKGFKIVKQDKENLLNFLTKKSYKLPNNSSISGFQKSLAEIFNDPERLILLAKLVHSDFDMEDIKKSVATNTTKKIKAMVSNETTRKSLTDFL